MRNELIPMYRELYHIYHMLNRVGWNGMLPSCALAVSQKQRRSWAYATPFCAAKCPLIAINSSACSRIDNDTFIGIMAHEMTHIWQYAQGRRGGHGREFKNEMRRIGLDYTNRLLYEDSPLVFTIKLHRMRNFNVTACFRPCAGAISTVRTNSNFIWQIASHCLRSTSEVINGR